LNLTFAGLDLDDFYRTRMRDDTAACKVKSCLTTQGFGPEISAQSAGGKRPPKALVPGCHRYLALRQLKPTEIHGTCDGWNVTCAKDVWDLT